MYKTLVIDTEQNKLLCSPTLVGLGELVEIYSGDEYTPSQANGRLLQKIIDPNVFIVVTSFDGHEAIGKRYELGEKCVLRILTKNLSGTRRRKFPKDEKKIVNMEHDDNFNDIHVSKAKTGAVRKKPRSK